MNLNIFNALVCIHVVDLLLFYTPFIFSNHKVISSNFKTFSNFPMFYLSLYNSSSIKVAPHRPCNVAHLKRILRVKTDVAPCVAAPPCATLLVPCANERTRALVEHFCARPQAQTQLSPRRLRQTHFDHSSTFGRLCRTLGLPRLGFGSSWIALFRIGASLIGVRG